MPLANEGSSDLRFDRADYAAPGAGPPCGSCKGPLAGQYWKLQQHAICANCREQYVNGLATSLSAGTFGKAALMGGGVALACGIAYAIFVAMTDYQLALVTIGIAFVIAKTIRKAAGGFGGRRFQILAVVLTYVASAMGYAPAVWSVVTKAPAHESAKGSPAASAAPTASAPSSEEAAPASPSADSPKPSIGGLLVAIVLLFGFTLAAPILAATEAPIGLLIVIFGLWEAWKLSRGPPLTLDGPYQVAPAQDLPASPAA